MISPKKRNKLKGIYKLIPHVECKGLCADQCTVIGMSKGESELLKEVSGIEPHAKINGSCCYLKDNKCSQYENRPTICRLYGAVQNLKCGHGCEVKYITEIQADLIISAVEKLIGDGKPHISKVNKIL